MTEPAAPHSATDPFFEVTPDGHWNACVGQQGDVLNYVDGYLEAARELIAAVIDKRLMGSRDTLAMPILYNCRHGLELALKYTIDRLHRMGMVTETHPVNHDIMSHWQHLQRAAVGDRELRAAIGLLEPFVTSLSSIDEDGQELRYAVTRDGARSLNKIAVVNLPLIRDSIRVMSAILHRIKVRLFDLESERHTNTHTAECSRADLAEIAGRLGHHDTWRSESFDEAKRETMERYGIGSRKFSAAVTAIKQSAPLAAIVGYEASLKYLSDDKAIAAIQLWAEAYPPHDPADEDLGLDYFNRDHAFREHASTVRTLIDGTSELLTPDEFADLQVLFYIGRNGVFGEHYEEELERTRSEHARSGRWWEIIYHLMSKTNLLESVVNGAERVGRPSLAAKLRELHAERFAILEKWLG